MAGQFHQSPKDDKKGKEDKKLDPLPRDKKDKNDKKLGPLPRIDLRSSVYRPARFPRLRRSLHSFKPYIKLRNTVRFRIHGRGPCTSIALREVLKEDRGRLMWRLPKYTVSFFGLYVLFHVDKVAVWALYFLPFKYIGGIFPHVARFSARWGPFCHNTAELLLTERGYTFVMDHWDVLWLSFWGLGLIFYFLSVIYRARRRDFGN